MLSPFIIFAADGKWRLEPCGNYSVFCKKSLFIIKLLKYLASTKKSFSKCEAVCISEVGLIQGFVEMSSSLKSCVLFWNLVFMLLLYEKGIFSAKITNAKSDRFGVVCVRYA